MCQGLKRLALTCQRVIGQPGQSGSRGPPGHGITGQNCRLCLAEEHHVVPPAARFKRLDCSSASVPSRLSPTSTTFGEAKWSSEFS